MKTFDIFKLIRIPHLAEAERSNGIYYKYDGDDVVLCVHGSEHRIDPSDPVVFRSILSILREEQSRLESEYREIATKLEELSYKSQNVRDAILDIEEVNSMAHIESNWGSKEAFFNQEEGSVRSRFSELKLRCERIEMSIVEGIFAKYGTEVKDEG